MANYQFALAWQSYTATSATSATEHPASNAARVTEPRKTWQSTTGVGAQLTCDRGPSPGTLGAAFVNGGTVSQWTVEQSASISSGYTAVTGSPFTVPADERVGNRRKAWLPMTVTQQYLRWTAAALVSGASVAELGSLALVPAASLITLSQNVGQPQFTIDEPDALVEFDGGGFDANSEGDAHLREYVLGQPTLIVARGLLDQLYAIRNARDVIVWENFGFAQHAYCGRILTIDPVTRAAFVTSAALHLREYA